MAVRRSSSSFAASFLVLLVIFALKCRDAALATRTTTAGFAYYGGVSNTTTGAPYYSPSCGWNCNTSTTTGNYFPGYTNTTTGPPFFDGGESGSPGYFRWGSGFSTRSPDFDFHSEDDGFREYGTTTRTSTMNPPPKSRYLTRVLHVREPTPEEKLRCVFTYSAGDLTNGRRSVLVEGNTHVQVLHAGDTVEIVSTSADQRPPPSGVFSKFMRSVGGVFFGSEERYKYLFSVPPGCMHIRSDPVAVASDIRGDSGIADDAVTSSSGGITGVAVRLSPEVFVRYATSPDTPPLFPDMSHFGTNSFAAFEHCLFGMEVTKQVGVKDLILLASPRTAAVDVVDRYTGRKSRVATLSIPCYCKPSHMGLISWWAGQGPRGYPVVVMYIGFPGFLRVSGCYNEEIRKGSFDDLSSWPEQYSDLRYFRE